MPKRLRMQTYWNTEYGSMTAAKENGKVRQEGKEYVVQDGDVMLFRFNV